MKIRRSYIRIYRHNAAIKKLMHIRCEQHPILHGVDGSCGLGSRWNGDPTTIVEQLPVPFVRQRKYLCSLEAPPATSRTIECLFPRDNTSPIPLADSITERSGTGSASDRKRTNQPKLIIDSDGPCLKLNCLTMYARKPLT